MNYYVFIYTFSTALCIAGGIVFFSKYKNLSGLSFLFFTLLSSLWFVSYFLFFSGLVHSDYLLIISRLAYAFGILGVYSFLLFIGSFGRKTGSGSLNFLGLSLNSHVFWGLLYCVFSSVILLLYVFTDKIVYGLHIGIDGISREIPGVLYLLHIGLHALFFFFLVFVSFKQIRRQTYLDRIRLINILLFGILLIATLLVFQLILPFFGIWLLEREIVVFFALFVLATIYTIKRYYFPRFGHGMSRLLLIVLSFILTIIVFDYLKDLSNYVQHTLSGFWNYQDDYGILSTFLLLFSFYAFYYVLSTVVLGKSSATLNQLYVSINDLQRYIPYILTIGDLNSFLKKRFYEIFSTGISRVVVLDDSQVEYSELVDFFKKTKTGIFINDIVFFDEECSGFDCPKIIQAVGKEACMIFPLHGIQSIEPIGLFILGFKPFGDFYSIGEIRAIQSFVSYLELHLRYLDSSSQLQELSKNLDEQVDKKTIEYNDLINRQKEFISTISHEIKSPIAGAIVQTDGIIDDLHAGISSETIEKELHLLSVLLLKIGDLASKLFSVQYYDTQSVSLFKERVNIGNLLNMEIDIYESTHEKVEFSCTIDRSMGFIEIDRIQFQQVVTNLLTNAIKFSDPLNPRVHMNAYTSNDIFYLIIEDNGPGFEDVSSGRVFEKYTVGSIGSVGLGLGLYLCKKIIDMHGGDIVASKSELFSGGKITVSIPL